MRADHASGTKHLESMEATMTVILVPVVAASLIGLVGMPAMRLMASSKRTRQWAKSQSGMLRRV
jgi:hypothetical protein